MVEKPQDNPLSIEPTMIRKALEQAHRDKALAASSRSRRREPHRPLRSFPRCLGRICPPQRIVAGAECPSPEAGLG